MTITIKKFRVALEVLKTDPGTRNLLAITDSDYAMPTIVSSAAKTCLHLQFDDVIVPREGRVLPSESDVKRSIAWAADKRDILVSCHGGISRSSAMAYLIACAREKSPRTAIELLDPSIHLPNELIVKYGAVILGDPEILEEYYKFRRLSLRAT
jgi:predicted protein tyrosine phosphatase